MTPAAFEEAVFRTREKFLDVYVQKMGLTHDDAVYKLIMASSKVRVELIYRYMLENGFFDAANSIILPGNK